MTYTTATIDVRPEATAEIHRLHREGWPRFMLQSEVGGVHWPDLFTDFQPFQFALFDKDDRAIAAGNTIPLQWDGTVEGLPEGWDAAIIKGSLDGNAGVIPNTLCALAAVIDPAWRGKGISALIISRMREIAVEHNFPALIAPVRPSHKSLYPITPVERYLRWTQDDGSPFDPWVRVHWKLGASLLKIAPRSMDISGTVAEWEEWTGMRFPESGDYAVPGALEPITIDRERDFGQYIEPNIWMLHTISSEDGER